MLEYRGAGIPLKGYSEGKAYDPIREQVRFLRQLGKECNEIAAELELSQGDVIVHCLKLGLPISGSCELVPISEKERAWLRYRRRENGIAKCPECGNYIIQPERGRTKKYCSKQCRDKHSNALWRKNRKLHGRKAVCENCRKIFYAINESRGEQRFCSRDCYIEHRYGVREEMIDENSRIEGSAGRGIETGSLQSPKKAEAWG